MQKVRKYSRQREAIYASLQKRYDHPTAETLYLEIKQQYLDISLATVYRNLKLLAEGGQIIRLTLENSDRFDANTAPHYHFHCKKCNRVLDLNVPYEHGLDQKFDMAGDHTIQGHQLMFYGLCENCN